MRRLSERERPPGSFDPGAEPGEGAAPIGAQRVSAVRLQALSERAQLSLRNPLVQLRLSSLRSLRLRILPPQGGKGSSLRDVRF
jgi:hypothetical protein